jgi:hypothetical protein
VVDGIALAPPFEYLPGLLPADAEHARLAAFVRRHHARLGGGPLELGVDGRTAREVVDFLRTAGAARVIVVVAHPDPHGAAALFDALTAGSIPALSSAELSAWSELPCAPAAVDAGAPWAARHGLERVAEIEALRARVAREAPERAAWLEAVIGFARFGVHPLAEIFAGNGLCERNRDFLVNLRP